MYGMVNRAVEEMVCGRHGEETWAAIKERAGVEIDVFVSNEAYPDELTYHLVGAAAEELQQPPAQVLEAFGAHWALHTAQDGYGALMKSCGATLPEFLHNLPTFHARVALIYPNLTPPRFRISHAREDSLHLHYDSHRQGLQPFVRGLLEGLFAMFGVQGRVQVLQTREGGSDHDEFLVEWG